MRASDGLRPGVSLCVECQPVVRAARGQCTVRRNWGSQATMQTSDQADVQGFQYRSIGLHVTT